MTVFCRTRARVTVILRVLPLPALLLLGCSGLFNTESFTDTTRSADGTLLLADTERSWADFVDVTNDQVRGEIDGETPPGVDSWLDHWTMRISVIRGRRENPEKYVEYIVDTRSRAGLPELTLRGDF